MAGSVNKVIIVGNLGRDPEVRTFQNGGRVCSFSVATGESWKDKATGERKERTEWHNISILNDNLITIAERFLKKGSKVYLEGQMETREFQDKEGNKRKTTEVVLRPFRGELTMLDGRRDGGEMAANDTAALEDGGASSGRGRKAAAAGGGSDIDDEIPF